MLSSVSLGTACTWFTYIMHSGKTHKNKGKEREGGECVLKIDVFVEIVKSTSQII